MAKSPSISELAANVASFEDRALAAWANDPRVGARKLIERERRRRAAALRESARLEAMLEHERRAWDAGVLVAGVDEVGVGPMAGPVVAGAVILPPGTTIARIDDSKVLDAQTREELAAEIRSVALACAIGSCSVVEIEELNVYQAAREAMRRAVLALERMPGALLVDARRVPGVRLPQTSIVKGDSKSQSIAAAAIVAKVHRDATMKRLATEYPGYGFEKHKGYYCPQHVEALASLGPCAIHRRSYAPVAERIESDELTYRKRRVPQQSRLF